MVPLGSDAAPNGPDKGAAREYVFDMIRQLAKMARSAGEVAVAIHLEAILAARRAENEDQTP